MEARLKGKTAVITGASRGLGKELALAIAREGGSLVICGRDETALKSVQEAAKFFGVECSTMAGDLLDERFIQDFSRAWPSRLDILINNAGVSHSPKPLQEVSLIWMVEIIQVNFMVPLLLTKAALPIMLKQKGGVIVNICSYCSRRGIPNLTVYCASKAALRIATESLAKELEGTGVQAFSVSPGGMSSDLRRRLFGSVDAAMQQQPSLVAERIVDALTGVLKVPNGADLIVRQGKFEVKRQRV